MSEIHEHADVEAVAAVLGGELEAFERIMRRYNQRLFRVARSILTNDDDALDAVQEGYIKAYACLGQLAAPDRVGAWLCRIVRNEALMARRRDWRNARLDEQAEARVTAEEACMTSVPPQADEHIARGELRALLESSVDALSDEFRSVFVLRALEGMSVQETSALLDLPEGTVKTRYWRSRALLRKHIEERLEVPLSTVFQFDGARCDRVVAVVMARLRAPALH